MKDIENNLGVYEGQSTWEYHIIWQLEETKEAKEFLIEEAIVQIEEKLMDIAKINKVVIKEMKIENYEIELIIESEIQLNINKIVNNLQKRMQQLCQLKTCKQPYLITSKSKKFAKEDLRIHRLIEALVLGEYYDLDEGMTDSDLNALKVYLCEKNLGVVDYNEQVFLIDREALGKMINLNCFECTKIHKYGCCCGSPCGLSSQNMKLFDQHMLLVEEAVRAIDVEQYKKLLENGGFLTANGLIKAYEGHCALLVQQEGVYKCIAHQYALEKQIPIYDLCPLSCLMYPLEIIELITDKRKKVILLTSVVDEKFADQFGRWGSYASLEVELRCIHEEAHNTIFKAEDYRPVYEVNKGLLEHEFGKAVYKGVKKLVESDDKFE